MTLSDIIRWMRSVLSESGSPTLHGIVYLPYYLLCRLVGGGSLWKIIACIDPRVTRQGSIKKDA